MACDQTLRRRPRKGCCAREISSRPKQESRCFGTKNELIKRLASVMRLFVARLALAQKSGGDKTGYTIGRD